MAIGLLAGCSSKEKMVLLDEEIAAIHISVSEGFEDMNEDTLLSLTENKEVAVFRQAILSAEKQADLVNMEQADYDVRVEYVDGLPTHALHLWLGEEGEESILMYFMDNAIYKTSGKKTDELRGLILGEN